MIKLLLELYKHCWIGLGEDGLLKERLLPEIKDWLERNGIKYEMEFNKKPNLMFEGEVLTYHVLPIIHIEDPIHAVEFKLKWL